MTTGRSPHGTDGGRAVAVVGMGIAVPGADDCDSYWELLNQDTPVFREPGSRYRLASFWSPDPETEDRSYNRTSGFRHGPEHRPAVTVQAEEEAGLDLLWLRHCMTQALDGVALADGAHCTVYVGAFPDGSQHLAESLLVEEVARGMAPRLPGSREANLLRIRDLLHARYPLARPSLPALLPDRVVRTAAQGLLPEDSECTVIDAACASSLLAVDTGARRVLAQECDLAVCGGVFMVTPRWNVLFSKVKGLTPSGDVRALDARADGTLFSDGAAIVVLKSVERARSDGDRVLGVITGFGASSDGAGNAIYAPSPEGQALALRRARHRAGATAADIDWLLTHGTGTPKGDLAELEAIDATGTSGPLMCTSNKSLLGHCGWNAGAVSLIHALLALRHHRVPAQQRFDRLPGPARTAHLRVPDTSVELPSGPGGNPTAGISSSGFGGINSHLIVRREPAPGPPIPSVPPASPPEPLAVVAWTALLPQDTGDPSDGAAGSATRFEPWQPPTFTEAGVPPPVIRTMDRAQQLGLRLAARFVAEHGEPWDPVRDTTGVLAAVHGPSALSISHLVRCYDGDMADCFNGKDAEAYTEVVTGARGSVGKTSASVLPGMIPNLVAARVSHRYDLHGPNLVVDAGDASGLAGLAVAAPYLRDGDLDLVLLLGVSAHNGPVFATAVDTEPDRIAEGGFLIAVCLPTVAQSHGWPVCAHLDLDRTSPTDHTLGQGTLTYLAAEAHAELVRVLAADDHLPFTIAAAGPGPRLTVLPPRPPAGSR
ncbi:beta-ketoacyl synthase N-terminal-like domain-containing protein [Streptomyces sp. NPDC088789]|uniref:beta-ketoacyl synthase N-terminal-like domain-containing protein n=1 Tax=Streptomyces sp. NPDC088789 TaxID=3365899 RepID=UPI0037F6F7A2